MAAVSASDLGPFVTMTTRPTNTSLRKKSRSLNYRIYSNKRRGAYEIFRSSNAALIRERCQLFQIGRDKEIFSFNLTVYFLSVRKFYSKGRTIRKVMGGGGGGEWGNFSMQEFFFGGGGHCLRRNFFFPGEILCRNFF